MCPAPQGSRSCASCLSTAETSAQQVPEPWSLLLSLTPDLEDHLLLGQLKSASQHGAAAVGHRQSELLRACMQAR